MQKNTSLIIWILNNLLWKFYISLQQKKQVDDKIVPCLDWGNGGDICFQLLIKHTWSPLDEQVIWLLLDVLLVYNKGIFRALDQSSKADFKTVALIVLSPGTLRKQLGENENDLNYKKVTSFCHHLQSDHYWPLL